MRAIIISMFCFFTFVLSAQSYVDTIYGNDVVYLDFVNCKTITAEIDEVNGSGNGTTALLSVSNDDEVYVPAVFMLGTDSTIAFTSLGAINSGIFLLGGFSNQVPVVGHYDISWSLFTNNYKYQKLAFIGAASDTLKISVKGVKRRWGD